MYFSGHVINVVFDNPDESFFILKLRLENSVGDSLVTVRGYIPGYPIKLGAWIGFEGDWVKHPKFGDQIQISKAPVFRDGWTPDTAEKLLIAHGVGSFLIEGVRAIVGDEVFLETLADPKKLEQLPNLDGFSVNYLHQKWQVIQAYFRSVVFLGDLGLPPSKIRQVWATFGDRAEEVLSQNPWALVEIPGITFQVADAVASRLGLSRQQPERVQGAVKDALQGVLSQGHLYAKTGDIHEALKRTFGEVTAETTGNALVALHKSQQIVIDKSTQPGTVAVYLPRALEIEYSSAKFLAERMLHASFSKTNPVRPYIDRLASVGPKTAAVAKKPRAKLLTVIETALEEWGASAHLELSDDQKQGICNALGEPVSILTGLPGSGKTTSLQAAVRIFQEAGVKFLLCAPTGIAAKNLAARTGATASTVHRAFAAQGSSEETRGTSYAGIVGSDTEGLSVDFEGDDFWGYSPTNPHSAEVVLLDEASMLDQHLLYRLLYSTSPQCRLVLIGDAAQLPSVGPGNVLRDMIRSGMFPTVNLTAIFRQKDTSDIVYAAHDIYRGQVPRTELKSDFSLVHVDRDEDALDRVLELARKLFDARVNFQILSPRHAGTVGVTNLNERLRTLLNPGVGAGEIRLGEDLIREDDRIMITRNNYKYGVFNGDVGKVSRVITKDKKVELKIFGEPPLFIQVPFREVSRLIRLAYACTVHKCVHPDTLVETTEGLLPIRDVQPTGLVASFKGIHLYTQVVSNTNMPAFRVQTRDGYSLVATPDHGIDVWDGTKYVRREVGSLVRGSILRLRMGNILEPAMPCALPGAPVVDVRAKKYALPTSVTSEVAEFLGLMVADGTLYDRGFRLAKRHLDLANRFADLCTRLFGVPVKRFFTLGAHHVEVSSTFLAAWLREVGGMSPKDKKVPECVLRSTLPEHKAFLRGVFADGTVNMRDGHCDHIEWVSVFSALRDTVRVMLLRCGIIAGTGREERALYIYGQNAVRFGHSVGFIECFKQARLLSGVHETHYSVPLSREESRVLRKEHCQDIGVVACQNAQNRQRISRHLADMLIGLGRETQTTQLLRERLQYHHVSVTELVPMVCPTMCLEVPDGHQFLQNGFSGWNSQGLEYDVIVMPLVVGFKHQLQRNLLYTAITRARRKVILVGSGEALAMAVHNDREDLRNTLFPVRLQKVKLTDRVEDTESVRRKAGGLR